MDTSTTKRQVFISYSHQDEYKARAILEALKKRNFEVFFDKEQLPEEGFEDALREAIANCYMFLVLWSSSSTEKATKVNSWIYLEAHGGYERNVVFQVVIEPGIKERIPEPFKGKGVSDLSNWFDNKDEATFDSQLLWPATFWDAKNGIRKDLIFKPLRLGEFKHKKPEGRSNPTTPRSQRRTL